jgi:phage FluMu gp28-like protein
VRWTREATGRHSPNTPSQRYSGHIEQIHLSDKWYGENLPPFKAAFEDGTIVVPRDADVLQDLRAIQVINGVPKLPKAKNKSADGKKRHGDSAIALALAYAASRMEVEEFDYRPVKARSIVGELKDRLVKVTAGFRGRKGIW